MRNLGVAVALGALAIGCGATGVAMAQAPGVVSVAYTVEPYAPPSTVTINGTGVRLRAEPSTATQVLSSGSTGLPLTVVGVARMSDWTWYQVILKSGQKAFIRSDLTSAPMRGGAAPAATPVAAAPAAAPAMPPAVAYTPPPTYSTAPAPTTSAALPPAPTPPAYTASPTPAAPPSTTISAMPPTASAPTYTPPTTQPVTQPTTLPPVQPYTPPTTQPITQPAAQPVAPPRPATPVQPPVQPETGGSAIWLTPGPASPTTPSSLQSNPQR